MVICFDQVSHTLDKYSIKFKNLSIVYEHVFKFENIYPAISSINDHRRTIIFLFTFYDGFFVYSQVEIR